MKLKSLQTIDEISQTQEVLARVYYVRSKRMRELARIRYVLSLGRLGLQVVYLRN